jgi:ribosomal protein S18 acetylase RimI-like enzyme
LDDKNNPLASLTATFKQPQNGAPAILKLQTLNVHNQLRSRGVGSWLIEALENRVTNYSQQRFIFRADVIIRGSAAFNGNKENLNIKDRKRIEFYEKLGFKIKKYSKKNMSLSMEKTVR